MTHLKVTLKHSTIGRPARQGACVKGLGLRKIGQSRVLENTPRYVEWLKRLSISWMSRKSTQSLRSKGNIMANELSNQKVLLGNPMVLGTVSNGCVSDVVKVLVRELLQVEVPKDNSHGLVTAGGG